MKTLGIVLLALLAGCGAKSVAPRAAAAPAAPLDPQRVQDQQDMTWADYRAIPGVDWADPSLVPSRKQFKVALVAIDFPDQPFVITLPKRSDLFTNPQTDPVPRAQVPDFYARFYNVPSAVNHGHTINGYWMEQSRGQVGIGKIDTFGPYRMPKNLFQYGLNEWGQQGGVPHGFKADGRMEPDADALWAKDAGDVKSKYDIVLRIYAGYDETSVWQEFGDMKFQTKEDIPAEWGNPDTTMPRWVVSRYVPWTSWKAGQMQWGLSSVRQGESSGTLTHEIVHFAFRVGDNNNNPYVQPYRRAGSGPWDIMDRGSFNGPGGPHRRWVVPAAEGASMPAGLMLRSKMRFNFLREGSVLKLTRSGLAQSGASIADVTARAVDPGPGAFAGVTVAMDGAAPQDRTPAGDMNADPLNSGRPDWNFYSMEVVQRIGYDSFTPDNGVLLAKNKNEEDRGGSCGANYNCFTWVIDAHPEDTGMLDYKRPHGEPVMRTVADYRQLNDALFHAGLNSGSRYEWEDTPNRLHFYVIDVRRDARGILTYTVGVRSLDYSGTGAGVTLTAGAGCTFTLTNTGTATDIFRLSGTQNALAGLKPGASQTVRASGGTVRAVSESDPAKSASADCK
jgi:M6 family metalloprotease-like protein